MAGRKRTSHKIPTVPFSDSIPKQQHNFAMREASIEVASAEHHPELLVVLGSGPLLLMICSHAIFDMQYMPRQGTSG